MTFPRELVTSSVWNQLGASIDALVAAVEACPDDLWGGDADDQAFWYVSFHTAFFLDLYVTGSADGFAPPPPFGLEELDPAGVLPPRAYSKVGRALIGASRLRRRGRRRHPRPHPRSRSTPWWCPGGAGRSPG